MRTRGPTSIQLNSCGKPGVLDRVLKSVLHADTAITRSSLAMPRRRLFNSAELFHAPAREWLALVSTRCARDVTSRSNHSPAVVSTTPDAAHVSRASPTIRTSITCAILGIFIPVYVQRDRTVDERRPAQCPAQRICRNCLPFLSTGMPTSLRHMLSIKIQCRRV